MFAGMQGRQRVRFAFVVLGTVAVAAGALAGSGETSRLVQGTVNGRIAFAADAGIALVNPDGTGVWGLGELLPGDADPAWSPDGTRLAIVTRWRTLTGIRVADGTGKTLRMLTSDGSDSSPTWSPDGSEVAYIGHGDGQIWIVGAGGSNRRQVTNDTLRRTRLSWSADGKTIVSSAYDTSACCDGDIYAYDLQSGTQTNLTQTPGGVNEQSPSVSPDGTHVAFTRCCEGGSQIFVMRIDGTDQQPLTVSSWDNNPTWSPDGSRIAFVRNSSIWSMPAAGGDATQLNLDINTLYGGLTWQPLRQDPTATCSLWGTPGPDLIVGTDGGDTICGFGGNDILIGLGGDDTISGGDGNDLIAGGQGRDILVGGPGKDRLDGRDGAPDRIDGGRGGDIALVDPSGDRLRGIETRRVSWNLATWRAVTASSSNPTGPADAAVDGTIEDWWNSGAYPAGWIEIDLGRPVAIGRIRLIAQDQPAQNPILVLGRGPDTGGTYRQLTRFSGPTVEKQELVRSPRKPWQRVRYLRIVVGAGTWPQGWVSWREIEVYPPGH